MKCPKCNHEFTPEQAPWREEAERAQARLIQQRKQPLVHEEFDGDAVVSRKAAPDFASVKRLGGK